MLCAILATLLLDVEARNHGTHLHHTLHQAHDNLTKKSRLTRLGLDMMEHHWGLFLFCSRSSMNLNVPKVTL